MSATTAKKGRPTPRNTLWEVKCNGKWYPAWRRSHKPRVGGFHMSRYTNFGRIDEVRPVVGPAQTKAKP